MTLARLIQEDALEAAAKDCDEKEKDYISQMEGQGEPEFQMCEFAACAMMWAAKRIRAMKPEKEAK